MFVSDRRWPQLGWPARGPCVYLKQYEQQCLTTELRHLPVSKHRQAADKCFYERSVIQTRTAHAQHKQTDYKQVYLFIHLTRGKTNKDSNRQ